MESFIKIAYDRVTNREETQVNNIGAVTGTRQELEADKTKVVYVSELNGDDGTGDGSIGNPYATIGVAAGDVDGVTKTTIGIIDNETYSEDIPASKPTQAELGYTPTIDLGAGAREVNASLCGCFVTGSHVRIYASLYNCTITGATTWTTTSGLLTLDHCYIYDNTALPTITPGAASSLIITRCLIVNNAASTLTIDCTNTDGVDIQITYTTFYGNSKFRITNNAGTEIFKNNILSGNTAVDVIDCDTDITLDHCIINSWGGLNTTGTNIIGDKTRLVDPLFRSTVVPYNFRLQSVAGGYTNDSPAIDLADEYDSAQLTSTPPAARDYVAAANLNGTLYYLSKPVTGGIYLADDTISISGTIGATEHLYSTSDITLANGVEITMTSGAEWTLGATDIFKALDPSTREWSDVDTVPPGTAYTATWPLIRPYDEFELTSFGDTNILLFGGVDNGAVHANTWTFDGSTWTQQAPVTSPAARKGHSLAYYGGYVYLFGGVNYAETVYQSDLYRWDGSDWALLTPDNAGASARAYHGTCEDSGLIFIVGGYTGAGSTEVWAYDPVSNDWSQHTSAPITLSDHRSFCVSGHIFAIGGTGASGAIYDYDIEAGTWSTVDISALVSDRDNFGVAVEGIYAYLFGGANSDDEAYYVNGSGFQDAGCFIMSRNVYYTFTEANVSRPWMSPPNIMQIDYRENDLNNGDKSIYHSLYQIAYNAEWMLLKQDKALIFRKILMSKEPVRIYPNPVADPTYYQEFNVKTDGQGSFGFGNHPQFMQPKLMLVKTLTKAQMEAVDGVLL